jgi:prepilin-type N-terminal cleavage/methylation domain-containing protein
MKRGFTLIEILFALLIIGILLAITVNSLNSAREKKQLEGIVDSIVAKLDEAKANSQTGKGGKNYGIKFNPDSYVYFSGSTYNASNVDNKIIKIDDKFQITENISNSDNVVIFSKIYGEVGFRATITIFKKTDSSLAMNIAVGKLGDISVIK